ncbi:hypothetical protein [Sphingomonas sp. PB2P12]|uniref:hypothetical protein n=1 Tax=Sphingomonas sandaracina TaxID=3096157 RepID=UPI002FC5AFB9
MKLGFACLAVVAFAWANPALADMTAHYVGPDETTMMTIEIASDGDLRMTFGDDTAYFLTHAGQDYHVETRAAGPMVMRQEDIAVAMIEQAAPKVRRSPRKGEKGVRLVARGEVGIRGRKGLAYGLVSEGRSEADDAPFLVVSDDPALAPLAAAMRRQFDTSFGTMHAIFGDASPLIGVTGMLAKGAPLSFFGFQLDTIDPAPISALRFVVPAAPLSLDAVRRDFATP